MNTSIQSISKEADLSNWCDKQTVKWMREHESSVAVHHWLCKIESALTDKGIKLEESQLENLAIFFDEKSPLTEKMETVQWALWSRFERKENPSAEAIKKRILETTDPESIFWHEKIASNPELKLNKEEFKTVLFRSQAEFDYRDALLTEIIATQKIRTHREKEQATVGAPHPENQCCDEKLIDEILKRWFLKKPLRLEPWQAIDETPLRSNKINTLNASIKGFIDELTTWMAESKTELTANQIKAIAENNYAGDIREPSDYFFYKAPKPNKIAITLLKSIKGSWLLEAGKMKERDWLIASREVQEQIENPSDWLDASGIREESQREAFNTYVKTAAERNLIEWETLNPNTIVFLLTKTTTKTSKDLTNQLVETLNQEKINEAVKELLKKQEGGLMSAETARLHVLGELIATRKIKMSMDQVTHCMDHLSHKPHYLVSKIIEPLAREHLKNLSDQSLFNLFNNYTYPPSLLKSLLKRKTFQMPNEVANQILMTSGSSTVCMDLLNDSRVKIKPEVIEVLESRLDHPESTLFFDELPAHLQKSKKIVRMVNLILKYENLPSHPSEEREEFQFRSGGQFEDQEKNALKEKITHYKTALDREKLWKVAQKETPRITQPAKKPQCL